MSSSYDYIIVGAGSAGCILANRLSVDPSVNVLLLEAGPKDRNPLIRIPLGVNYTVGGKLDWRFTSAPEMGIDNRAVTLPRGRVLGGSSSINGMIFVRGHAEDFNEWARSGATGWGYRDVLPYFKRLETWQGPASAERGANGPITVSYGNYRTPLFEAFLEAGRQMGHAVVDDYNTGDHEGFDWVQYNIDTRRGVRCSAAHGYLLPIRTRQNLTVITGAQVTKLVLIGNRCTGLRYLLDGHEKTVHAAETVLSAGAYMSPQLLMLSGIGPAGELRRAGITPTHALPGVGKNLQDHFGTLTQFECTKPLTYYSLKNPVRGIKAVSEYVFKRSGPISVFPMSAQAFLRSSDAEERPNLQFQFYPVSRDLKSPKGGIATFNAYTLQVGLMRPRSRGEVTLASADPLAPPRIQHNALSDPYDVQALVDGLRLARDIQAQDALREFSGKELDPGASVQSDQDIRAYNRRNIMSEYHPSGTCKIGSDELAVVDAHLRVHGIEGLRVADASVMPVVTSGNTNAPAMMIGEKASALILEH